MQTVVEHHSPVAAISFIQLSADFNEGWSRRRLYPVAISTYHVRTIGDVSDLLYFPIAVKGKISRLTNNLDERD
jgi:hypothetical protein